MNSEAAGIPRQVAIVTGGSRGIGRAVVQRLARAGHDVFFTYLSNISAANAVVDELGAQGHAAYALCVDARDVGRSRAAVEDILARSGRIDVLVNNAGITADRLLAQMTEREWTEVLGTSLNALYGFTQPVAKRMMRQRAGRIVNVTSVSGLVGIEGQTNYCTAKAGIIGFTRSLASPSSLKMGRRVPREES